MYIEKQHWVFTNHEYSRWQSALCLRKWLRHGVSCLRMWLFRDLQRKKQANAERMAEKKQRAEAAVCICIADFHYILSLRMCVSIFLTLCLLFLSVHLSVCLYWSLKFKETILVFLSSLHCAFQCSTYNILLFGETRVL